MDDCLLLLKNGMNEKRKPSLVSSFTLSDAVGIGAILLALAAALLFGLVWAVLPLVLYLLLCVSAPFLHSFGFFLPLISRGSGNDRHVAMTFDDGPYPDTTPLLLSLLDRHGVKAAFFVVGKQAEANPGLVAEILARGHEIGNHSHGHDVLLMLKGRHRLRAEIAACQTTLLAMGVRPLAFRPPVGITNPRLRRALDELGLYCVTFSRRARDRGNQRIEGMAQRILSRVRDGDIILLHDCPPKGGIALWLDEMEALIQGLIARKLRPVLLSSVIRRDVTEVTKEATVRRASS